MNKLTRATIGLLERRLVKTATVLAVRVWDPATFREIDLHMPGCDMRNWQQAQHMKCRVAPLVYRDYTPSGWDAETQTCTLFIDTAHEGPGSCWAKGLSVGDAISYLGISSAHQQPVPGKRMIFLGDETAIGHFLSLQQLAGLHGLGGAPGPARLAGLAGSLGLARRHPAISGAIVLSDRHHLDEFARYFPQSGLEALHKGGSGYYAALEEWVSRLEPGDPSDTVFYLAGYGPAVAGLRKILREKGYGGSQVKAQGFWN